MLYRLEFGPASVENNGPGNALSHKIALFLGFPIEFCRIVHVYTINGLSRSKAEKLLEMNILHDPYLQNSAMGKLPCLIPPPDWFCEVAFRPGVTDNEARTARKTIAIALEMDTADIQVYTSIQYRIGTVKEQSLSIADIEKIAANVLCNPLIQTFRIMDYSQWDKAGFAPMESAVTAKSYEKLEFYNLLDYTDQELLELSRKHTWALSSTEIKSIVRHFQNNENLREKFNLPPYPSDVEIEAIAQTWSEHCKHKIFASKINYYDKVSGRHLIYDNLYKSCIRDTTALLRKEMGDKDYCLSVFKDNAGVISFINGYDACIKVETHNSPSALDPYGGALTGIVGVNRDPLGTGMGADLVCNMDVFCFAPPDYAETLPPRIMHPGRILEGVRKGIEDGGNKSGIPTVNGSIVFDNRFLGKPLVFCGTVGLIPAQLCGHPGYEKKAQIGDIIVMAGGRIGKDGIHGATFSSEELHEGSPATAVQIGDPITQRKMYDFILVARDKCLFNSITDNGAGGLSSSVGEMAEDTGGCRLELSKAPLKYDGLAPWEILLSEAQERMTFAVPKNRLEEFEKLAAQMDVETAALGEFTNSGFFEIRYKDKIVGLLDMEFLHHGDPQLNLHAIWEEKEYEKLETPNLPAGDLQWHNEFLEKMLSSFNIRSRESIIRQYDHEVRGGSVVKPLVGIKRDGPSDAAVLRPLVESDAGLVLAHGICPKYSDFDTYWMVANAVDEAVRNAVAVGANPDFLAGVDNFCWCDPVESSTNPDGAYKLAQLVRACESLRQFCFSYGIPCISGKDSMKNDYLGDNNRISIPPTLLFTVLGVMPNVTRAQTSDFKTPGDHIYLLGKTWDELGASEAFNLLGIKNGNIPFVDAQSSLPRYQSLHGLMEARTISACHDCSDGGFIVALAEMAIGGRLGCQVDINRIIQPSGLSPFQVLYSESASRHIVTCKPEFAPLLDALCQWQAGSYIGIVTEKNDFILTAGDAHIINIPVERLVNAFKNPSDAAKTF